MSPCDSRSMSKSSAPTAATPSMPSVARAGWRTRLRHANPTAFIVCASRSPLRRSSAHDATTVAAAPSGTAIAMEVSATSRRDAHEDERRVVAPLEERVDEAFGQDRQHQAERGTRPGDDEALEQHLHEDAAHGQADEPKDADGLAPLVHEHDGEREQEDGGRDDRHDGDGEVEALEHAEGSGRSGGLARRPRDHTRHARVDVAREGAGVRGIGQRDVDGRDVLGARRRARRPREVEQIGQVQPHLAGHRAEPRRIGRRLVDAGDAELARASSGGVGRQPDDAADGRPSDAASWREIRMSGGRPCAPAARGTPTAAASRTILQNDPNDSNDPNDERSERSRSVTNDPND